MFDSELPQDHAPVITLIDEQGRSLDCYVERELAVAGKEYLLLLPVDHPVEIFVWEDDEESDAILLDDEKEIQMVFADAQAVLAEQNLTLKWTAFTLTVAGDLPPVEDEDLLTMEIEDDEFDLEPEEFQLLATFYHQDQEYSIYTPRDPMLLCARRNLHGKTELVPPDEVQPFLENMLSEDLED